MESKQQEDIFRLGEVFYSLVTNFKYKRNPDVLRATFSQGIEKEEFSQAKKLYSPDIMSILTQIFDSDNRVNLPTCESLLGSLKVYFSEGIMRSIDKPDLVYRGGLISILNDSPDKISNYQSWVVEEGTFKDLNRNQNEIFLFGKGKIELKKEPSTSGFWYMNYLFGMGELNAKNMRYTGIFRRGLRRGPGSMTILNHTGTPIGPAIVGYFYERKKDTKTTIIFPDGKKYEGHFLNGLFHGHGTLEYADGSTYKGDFIDGLYHGTGEYRIPGIVIYKGGFKNSQFDGIGYLELVDDKTIYEGSFVNGEYQGQGKINLSNGAIYEGQFMKGRFYGPGKLTFPIDEDCETNPHEKRILKGYFDGNKCDNRPFYLTETPKCENCTLPCSEM